MIRLFLFSVRNVMRNTRRSILTIAIIIFSFLTLSIFSGYITNVKQTWGEMLIHNEYGHLQIYHRDFFKDDETAYTYMITGEEYEIIKRILKKHGEVTFHSPRINISGLIGNDKISKIFFGSARDPKENEDMYYSSPIYRNNGEFITNETPTGIVTGTKLAEKLGARVGDEVLLMGYSSLGSIEATNVKIIGLSKIGYDATDAMMICMNINAAREFLLTESYHYIVVILTKTEDIDRMQKVLNDEFGKAGLKARAYTFYEIVKFYVQIIAMYTNYFNISLAILSLIIIFAISNTIYMSITDRTREFSTMKTIGMSRRTIFLSIVFEGMILSLIAVVLGIVISYAGHEAINRMSLTLAPPPGSDQRIPFMVTFEWGKNILICAVQILLGCVASMLPAFSVIRMSILKGLSSY